MKGKADKAIKFFFLAKNIDIRERSRLKSFLVDLLRKEGKEISFVNFIFCSDRYLLEINRQYLSHDYYTDIITFDLTPDATLLEAEIYISTDRIRENAWKLGVPIKQETFRVMFHGLLHLAGYKDKTKKDRLEMRERESFYIQKYIS